MWDLPTPGLEPVSPALAGRFSTSAPPGKPLNLFLNFHMKLFFWNLLKKAEFIVTFVISQNSRVCVCLKNWQLAFWDILALFPSPTFFCTLVFHYLSCTIILTFILLPVVYGQYGPLSGRELCWISWRVHCRLKCASPFSTNHPLFAFSKWTEPVLSSCCSQIGFPVFPLLSILCVLLFLDLLNALSFPSNSSCRSADASEILWLLVVFLFVSWVLW